MLLTTERGYHLAAGHSSIDFYENSRRMACYSARGPRHIRDKDGRALVGQYQYELWQAESLHGDRRWILLLADIAQEVGMIHEADLKKS
jgi:hypothetical protein